MKTRNLSMQPDVVYHLRLVRPREVDPENPGFVLSADAVEYLSTVGAGNREGFVQRLTRKVQKLSDDEWTAKGVELRGNESRQKVQGLVDQLLDEIEKAGPASGVLSDLAAAHRSFLAGYLMPREEAETEHLGAREGERPGGGRGNVE